MRRLWGYVRPHRALVLLSLALLLAVSAAQLAQPYLIKLAIDGHIAPARLEGLGRVALLFLAALGSEFLLRFAQLYVLERTGQNVVLDLRHALFSAARDVAGADDDVSPEEGSILAEVAVRFD